MHILESFIILKKGMYLNGLSKLDVKRWKPQEMLRKSQNTNDKEIYSGDKQASL